MEYFDIGALVQGKLWPSLYFAGHSDFWRFTASDWLKRPVAQARPDWLIPFWLYFCSLFIFCPVCFACFSLRLCALFVCLPVSVFFSASLPVCLSVSASVSVSLTHSYLLFRWIFFFLLFFEQVIFFPVTLHGTVFPAAADINGTDISAIFTF